MYSGHICGGPCLQRLLVLVLALFDQSLVGARAVRLRYNIVQNKKYNTIHCTII